MAKHLVGIGTASGMIKNDLRKRFRMNKLFAMFMYNVKLNWKIPEYQLSAQNAPS
jgi:hypothetical protein